MLFKWTSVREILGALTGLLYGLASPIGGVLITRFGFQFLFILAGAIHLLAALISLFLPKIAKEFSF